ncbi:fumarylacetoacetate hydrolase family protein [Conexibacter sp. CPCC 206217]|uniref:fumarylacetoacetate hydrolase family protein n=1 Tax=Conexibacter sp. CPCC 206217 TaxID=3064574 RepID=UPI00272382DD|nr:fumarylacetoacetate hydrolase family protein [Conexibacter sp. CPCC 206217]MDO8208917.1 fumarylacetoacetate hydrolase family protein [Conexibacter sp. CPCC 206217]
MRTVEFRRDGELRLAVIPEHAEAATDVTAQLPTGAAEPAGLAAAIRLARTEHVPLCDLLAGMAERSGEGVDVDAARGWVGGLPVSAPVVAPETWAAGVTYRRSREAREAESEHAADVYAQIYDAERPEIFLKDVGGRRSVGPHAPVAIRGDSAWTVPEPELALILDADGAIVAVTLGDDVTARDIEARNPLYLPQAKIYDSACSLGPCALIAPAGGELGEFELELTVRDAAGELVYTGTATTASMVRGFEQLSRWLRRSNTVGDGTVLLTGTGIVPPDDVALQPGHIVAISCPRIGTLTNEVFRHPTAEAVSVSAAEARA